MKRILISVVSLFISVMASAQFSESTKGLLLMPSAEMEPNGTFMISNSFLNKNYLPYRKGNPYMWGYNTFGYGFSITFWSRLEVAYILTIFNGAWNPQAKTWRSKIMKNQDRHFAARFQVLKENEFDLNWMPSVVIGVSDPTTGGGGGGYFDDKSKIVSNGFFHREYVAATKHFNTPWGEIGAHAGYQLTRRRDFIKPGPMAAVTWNPVWLNQPDQFLSSFRLIGEYDAETINIGFSTSVWKDHFEGWFCLQNCQWVSAGLRYKLVIK